MAKYIRTAVDIAADKETVWNILTDFEKYAEWNPFIKSVSGEVKEGNRIKVTLQGMVFKPRVLSFIKNSEIKWLGHLWFKGLFDGEHSFHLSENSDGNIRFEQNERFKGILVKLFAKSLDRDTKKGFEEMNQALKQRAERFRA